ncbi:MAG: glycine betaine ABC transporter substrate-binding protein [Cyanobacteriota bacterium]|nr:glycine betaine ABC transporter substrate-binding protein [Cyanobacteriota bacterium]
MSRGWAIAVALLLASCGQEPTLLRVGAKNFAEQQIVGEMYALMLEDNGFTVERQLDLGDTNVAMAALESGDIDLYPEYTGTALMTVLNLPPSSDPQAVYDTVRQAYHDQFEMVWLDPSPMNNTQALALTETRADALDLHSLSDFVAQAPNLVLAGPPEFEVRPDGLPGLRQVYGNFTLGDYRVVDLDRRYQALVTGEADLVVAFGTDGEIDALNLVVLEDDRGLFPPYQIAPVVRQSVLDQHPELATALNQLSPLLNDGVMRQVNYQVTGQGRSPEQVAREFLVNSGLIAE